MQGFLNFSKLKIKPEDFYGTYPSKVIDKWTSYAENHKSQLKKIIGYLNTHLKLILPDNVVIENIANKKDFLKIHKNATIPFNINGRTDIILVKQQCVVQCWTIWT